MTTDEAQLVSAVSMLKALGVEEESDIEVEQCPLRPICPAGKEVWRNCDSAN